MSFSQGANSRLAVAKEASFGVLPTSPSWQTIQIRSHSLDLTKGQVTTDEIVGDRQDTTIRHGNRAAGGPIEVNLRRGAYDTLLESLMFSTFDTNDQIETGITPQFLAFEDAALDISRFRQFSGCLVNSATFSIAPEQNVQTTFNIVGRNMVLATSSLGSPTAPVAFEPFDSFNGALLEGGISTGDDLCVISQLQFSVTNEVTPAHVILCEENRDLAAQMQFGMATIEGTLTAYYSVESAALITKFLNETETSLSVTVDDPTGTNGYTFYMPRIKYMGASVPVANMQSRMVELPFRAIKDVSDGYTLRITRTN